jgi:hypothetical protein
MGPLALGRKLGALLKYMNKRFPPFGINGRFSQSRREFDEFTSFGGAMERKV